ncbi:hypothetical protein ANO11243_056870 [Dothideomycetidae sp. 11243]|nr:hypothetical protein ANO11243_056870 [fungal sp. No.11243]
MQPILTRSSLLHLYTRNIVDVQGLAKVCALTQSVIQSRDIRPPTHQLCKLFGLSLPVFQHPRTVAYYQIFSPTVATLVSIGLIVCYGLYRAILPKPLPGIPYNHDAAKNVLGDVPAMMKHVSSTSDIYMDWIKDQGSKLDTPIFQILFPFGRPRVIVTDHREALDVLLRRGKEFDRSMWFASLFRGTLPHSYFIMPTRDPRFKPQKKLFADTMTPTFLTNVAAKHIYDHSLTLVDLWRTKARLGQGKAFVASADINHMGLDTMWAVTFGSDIGTVKSQCEALKDNEPSKSSPADKDEAFEFDLPKLPAAYEAIVRLTHDIITTGNSQFPLFSHWLLRRTRKWQRANALKNALFKDRLSDAKARLLSANGKEELIDCATDHVVFREHQAALKEDRAPQYDSPAVRDDLFAFLFAGHETTSTTLQWGLKLLADHPAVQTQLRSVLHKAFPDQVLPSGAGIAKASIPYLDATIEEILRVGLSGVGQVRQTLCDTQLLGCAIPKGTEVILLCNGPGYLQPDPFVSRIPEKDRSASSQAAKDRTVPDWNPEDIADFDPQRWLKSDGGKTVYDSNAGPNRQFGAGERGCFGRKLAYLQLRIILVTIVWHFELAKCPETLSSYAGLVTATRPPKQCYVRPIPLTTSDQNKA